MNEWRTLKQNKTHRVSKTTNLLKYEHNEKGIVKLLQFQFSENYWRNHFMVGVTVSQTIESIRRSVLMEQRQKRRMI